MAGVAKASSSEAPLPCHLLPSRESRGLCPCEAKSLQVLLIYLGEIQMTGELIAQLAALFLILGAGPIIVVLLYVRGGNL